MNAYPIKLSNGVTKFGGHMVVTDDALIFLCSGKGSALLDGAGIALRGIAGSLLRALGDARIGEVPAAATAEELRAAATELPGSIVFDARSVEKLHDTWVLKMIKWDGKKIGVPTGFSKELRQELVPWAARHGIKTKGL